MPFDYMHSDVPARFVQAPGKAQAMYEQELRQRAGLLRRLGYGRDDALQRLRTNLRWDWEANDPPPFVATLEEALPELVAAVYAR